MKKTTIILACIALTFAMFTSCTHSHETKTMSETDSTEFVIDTNESALDSSSFDTIQ